MPELDMITGQEQVPPLRPPAPATSLWTELMDQVTPMERPVGAAPTDQMTGVDELTGRPVFQSTVGQRYTFIDQEQTDQKPSLAAAKENWTDMISYLETTSTPELFKDIGSGALEIIKETYSALERVTRGGGNTGDLLAAAGFAFGAGSTAPAPRGALRIFAGPLSADDRLTDLKLVEIEARLRELQARGVSEPEIDSTMYKEFGTFVLPDGNIRVEIPDYNAEFSPKFQLLQQKTRDEYIPGVAYAEGGKLSEFFDHPELFAAYPDLRDMGVVLEHSPNSDFLGTYNPRKNEVWLNTSRPVEEMRGTLLHELQHWVQEQEGFDVGSNPDSISPIILHAEDKRRSFDSRLKIASTQIRESEELVAKNQHYPMLRDLNQREVDYWTQQAVPAFRNLLLIRAAQKVMADNPGQFPEAYSYTVYKNSMGEVEADYVKLRDELTRKYGDDPNYPQGRAEVLSSMERPDLYAGWDDSIRSYTNEDIERFIRNGVHPNNVPLFAE